MQMMYPHHPLDLDTLQLKLTRFNCIKSGRPRISLDLFGTMKNRQVYEDITLGVINSTHTVPSCLIDDLFAVSN